MLIYDIDRPDEPRDGGTVAVMLHGRGSHRGDLQGLRPGLPPSWTLVTPQAPHPGERWGYGPGWAWYRYLGEDEADAQSLDTSLEALDDFLAGLPEIVGFAPGRIVLGGFSQGGTTSFAYALTRPGAIAGALNFSGFLSSTLEVPSTALSPDTPPLFWAHGRHDPAIPFQYAERGRARLEGAGFELTTHDHEIGHWIVAEEVAQAVRFIEGLPG